MAVVANLPPLLFLTFRSMYGISYSLLGMLVLVNFSTQLSVDLIFSFFSHKFPIAKTVRTMPMFASVGLLLFALAPVLFPNAVYAGLVIGTIIFSVSAGLGEVLISPVIAAIPAVNPEREMSKVHSIYAWGTVGVVLLATLFLYIFGGEAWQILPVLFTVIPLTASFLYMGTTIPDMETPAATSGAVRFLKNGGVWLCVMAIFFGGASECIMAQWASGYLEKAVGMKKILGDVFGVALFAAMLGLGRSLYAKMGKNILRVLLCCAAGAFVCYLTAALSPVPVIGLIACALTGLCTSMLWPGSLVVASDRYPNGGVLIFALMAAGGDMGASIGPQLVGVITDAAVQSTRLIAMASGFGLAPEQFGMKLGMLIGALFPLAALVIYLCICHNQKKKDVAV
jgi:MFS family permease